MLEEPLYQNIAACLATLIYVKGVVGACDAAVTARVLPSDISRKIVHCAAGAWCLFWPFFNEDHWTWQLNVAIPAVYSVQLAVKGGIIQDPNDPDVKTMSRSGRPIELCQGPLLFALGMLYTGLYQFKTTTGIYIMAAMGFGDGIAPLVGKRFPFGYYRTFGQGQYKTVSGSIGMFLATLMGVIIFHAGIGAPAVLHTTEILGMAVVATLAEAVGGKWDNPLIPAAVWCYMRFK
jgi:phytol kinase